MERERDMERDREIEGGLERIRYIRIGCSV